MRLEHCLMPQLGNCKGSAKVVSGGAAHLNFSVGLLPGFPGSPGCSALPHLQKPCRHGPEPLAGLDGSSAEEYPPFMLHYAADHLRQCNIMFAAKQKD